MDVLLPSDVLHDETAMQIQIREGIIDRYGGSHASTLFIMEEIKNAIDQMKRKKATGQTEILHCKRRAGGRLSKTKQPVRPKGKVSGRMEEDGRCRTPKRE